ncbi:PREDICTED: matrilysin [Elephantulus edwardii]|uniref:matrilysin n=1 Tax=Elephantulus edwardii TaxID=28737 RepID=UPI0003F0B787|nr:PREDICTED: matrilysin [Elephantulus edwardii]
MWLQVLGVLCLLPNSLALPLPLPLPLEAGGLSEQEWKQAQNYLKRFYPYSFRAKDENSLKSKLKEMQKFFGLPTTGILSSRVKEIMQKPRCGVPDVLNFSISPSKAKWTSDIITYRIASYTVDLPESTVDELVEKALDIWSEKIPIEFQRVFFEDADIVIRFTRGVHGDAYPFDGPGNTLAHAFFPGEGLGGDVHFDADEYWTNDSSTGTNFLFVATHELGHSLGLSHSSDPNAVMYPTYKEGDMKDFGLSKDDIESIQKLYGKRPELKYP